MQRPQKTAKAGCPCEGMLETKSNMGACSVALTETDRKDGAEDLLERILDRNNLNQAYLKVKKNGGSAGIDGMTVEEMLPYLKEHREQLLKCLNTGVVTGDDYVGAISGNAKSDTPWCYALAYSAANLSGIAGSRAEWVTSSQILSGEICFKLNYDNVTYEYYGITAPLSQNIGSDPLPAFGSSAVTQSGSSYTNGEYRVTAECERGYGSVDGAGSYNSGEKVTLIAKPAAGCVFDHFEVKSSVSGKREGWGGDQNDYPTTKTETYKDSTITLTEKITKSYTVRAVFKIFDDTPDDMKVTVKLELECTNDVDGWNNDTIPVTLIDSAGVEYQWSTNRNDLNGRRKLHKMLGRMEQSEKIFRNYRSHHQRLADRQSSGAEQRSECYGRPQRLSDHQNRQKDAG